MDDGFMQGLKKKGLCKDLCKGGSWDCGTGRGSVSVRELFRVSTWSYS